MERPVGTGSLKRLAAGWGSSARALVFVAAAVGLLASLVPSLSLASDSYTLFESDPVRPLALSPDGTRLFVVNTPDARLEIFSIRGAGLVHESSVPVGSEPVAVAARTDGEVWVVNQLSDSLSIVDVSAQPPRVVRTLQMADEPRDIVFAGPGRSRAFITAAHRGQHSPYVDPDNPGELTTAGTGRADVWVFDATTAATSTKPEPITVLSLFGDTPRALAVSPDGNRVYAAVFRSGNQTTAINDRAVCDGGALAAPCQPVRGELVSPGGMPGPNFNVEGVPGPETSLIVKYDGEHWMDAVGRSWDTMVRFDLPDLDVFSIDAAADPPVMVSAYPQVGTVLFNMAVNPVSGVVYVANAEARNEVRFAGTRPPGSQLSTVVGRLHQARISVLSGAGVAPRHLNKHIDYSVVPSPPETKARSLSTPLGMEVSADGQSLYVAAFGSQKVGVFNVAALESDSFVPNADDHIELSGGGPTGLVLDESRGRLYVATRFDNGLSIVDLATATETDHYLLHNPEPPDVVAGRPFLYDARLTSSNGEASCGGCHVFGGGDALAWNLGDPLGKALTNPNPGFDFYDPAIVHPIKGPMMTQPLRGLVNHGPMHWRGDRTGAAMAGGDPFDERQSFAGFNDAFVGVIGREEPLAQEDFDAFVDFTLRIVYPPSPILAFDGSLTPRQSEGRVVFEEVIAIDQPRVGPILCAECHVVDPGNGLFGSTGEMAFSSAPQDFKIPHLRALYDKVGMFGIPNTDPVRGYDNRHRGPQIRAYGISHDGSFDTIAQNMSDGVFTQEIADGASELEQYLFAIPSEIPAVVGQQLTLSSASDGDAESFLDLLHSRASLGECDLVAKGVIGDEQRGALRLSSGPDEGMYQLDRAAESLVTDQELRELAKETGHVMTYTCTPRGSGQRLGIDRDEDGVLDGDDVCRDTADAGQGDSDGDGVGDACDSCIERANPDQRDSNGDGYGNLCDADLDNDQVTDLLDVQLFRAALFGTWSDADLDGDGWVGLSDVPIVLELLGNPPGPSALRP